MPSLLTGAGSAGLALHGADYREVFTNEEFFFTSLGAQILGSAGLFLTGLVRGGTIATERHKAKSSVADAATHVVQKLNAAARSESPDKFELVWNLSLHAFVPTLEVQAPRLCLYRLEFNDTTDGGAVRTLVLVDTAGRGDRPQHRDFAEGSSPAADANFSALDGNKCRLIRSVSKHKRDAGVDARGKYEAFLNVPIYAGNRPEGMLTIDCTDTKGLTKHHEPLGWLIAKFLGIALKEDREKRQEDDAAPTFDLGPPRPHHVPTSSAAVATIEGRRRDEHND